MKKHFLLLMSAVASVTVLLCLSSIVQAAESDTETLVQVKKTEITARQWAASKKISEIRNSLKRAAKTRTCKARKSRRQKVVAPGTDWVLYESAKRDFSTVVHFPQETNPPLTIQTETITFPDGSMAHYTCHCEGASPEEDTCKFSSSPGGEPNLNSCTGGECCSVVVHVIDSDGTPIATFPG